jgi:predicted dehydrogenase
MAKQARELIKSGAIGNIRMVMGEYPQGWLSSGDGGKGGIWRCDPKLSGGSNALGDIGTHIEHMVSFMTGLKIKRVLAKMDVMAEGRTLDDNSVVLLEYEGGASGTYWVSQIALGYDNDLKIRIFGSKGSVEWCQANSEELYLTGEDGVRKLYRRGYGSILPKAAKYSRLPAMHNEGYLEALGNIYLSFCDCVVNKQNGSFKEEDIDFPTIEDGKNGVKFINRCTESSKKGNIWIDF